MLLSHPTISVVSIKGVQYNAEDKVIEVPDEIAPDLIAKYGFRPADADPAPFIKPLNNWSKAELEAKAVELGIDITDLKHNDIVKAVRAALKAIPPEE